LDVTIPAGADDGGGILDPMRLKENATEGGRRDRLRLMDKIGIKSIIEYLLYNIIDRIIFHIVPGEGTDGPFQLGSSGNLLGITGKLEDREARRVSEIRAAHTGRPIRIVVGDIVSVDLQFSAPTIFPLRDN
jgi:hypothetical protein